MSDSKGYQLGDGWDDKPGAGKPSSASVCSRPPQWPKSRTVGRMGEMAPPGDSHLVVHLQEDGDVIIAVTQIEHGRFQQADAEFCTVGCGGGHSPRVRLALIALMVAIEEDNQDSPDHAWPPEGPNTPISEPGFRNTEERR